MSRRWLRVVAVALSLFAVGLTPYLFAWLTCPPDRFYTGLMFNVPDHAEYWSWVTASRKGLFISNTMTPEPNPPTFMNPLMWTLAHVQAWFGLSFAALFQLWRLAAALAIVAAMVLAVRTFVPNRLERRTAFWLVLLGAGAGWIWVVVKYAARLGDAPFPHDLYTAEPNTFWGLLAYPYLPLAQALVVATLTCAWRVHQGRGAAALAGSVAAALGLALSHAYDLLTVYATLGVMGLVLWIRNGRFPTRLAAAGAAVGLVSGPVAFYYQQLTAGDPLWQAILAQYPNAGVWTPPHLHLFVLMGLPLLLAVAAVALRAIDSDERLFALVWAVCGLMLIYAPVVYQIKLLTAWQVPLAILAAAAWHDRLQPSLAAWLARRGHLAPQQLVVRFGAAVMVAATLPTNLYLFAWRFTELRKHDAPYFLRTGEKAALDWLAANATADDVAIAPLALGQYVPNYGGTRAFVAHWAMTVRFFERRAAAERFFDPATPQAERWALLDADRVTLVLRPIARNLAPSWDPSTSTGFALVFDSPEAQVYRVQRP